MQLVEGQTLYSASDLNNFVQCHYLTELDRLVARGGLARPEKDASTELVAQKGLAHEARYLQRLRDDGFDIVELTETPERTIEAYKAAARETADLMSAGKHIIYQPTFFDGTFVGRADFLMRVDEPSAKWAWSYEPVDTKLALHSKPYFIIQLCHYAEHIEAVQGSRPKQMHIVLGDGSRDSYKINDFFAYYQYLRNAFLNYAAAEHPDAYPIKTEHCGICTWSGRCDDRRRTDDHLILVAGMRTDQVKRFNDAGVTTVAELAVATDDQRPERMGLHTFARLRNQARLQMEQRTTGELKYDLLQHQPWEGYGLMPPPAQGDVFFDMEGDPLYDIGKGLEYLFGMWLPGEEPVFKAFWGTDRLGEKRAFEQFVDFIIERRRAYPEMHVYHYADYEKSALRRLAQRHATREAEVDQLLKGEVLVDLYAVVRRALMISQESYSIKKFEPFYGLKRSAQVLKGDDSIMQFERWLEDASQTKILEQIEKYNAEDCESTLLLRDWLLERKAEAEREFGTDIAFRKPVPVNGEGKYDAPLCHGTFEEDCKKCVKREKDQREERRTTEMQRALLDGIVAPESESEFEQMNEASRARYLLGNLLAYHRREAKPVYWEFFDRCDKVDQLVEFDKDCLGGLELCADAPPYFDQKKRLVATYTFPEQHYDVNGGRLTDPLRRDPNASVGSIVGEIDDENRRITIALNKYYNDDPGQLRAIVPMEYIAPDPQAKAVVRVAERYETGGLAGSCTHEMLYRHKPRLAGLIAGGRIQPESVEAQAIYEIVAKLDNSYLFVQGPPGSGKSTKGGEIIVRLLNDGKRVGVMSNSHKAAHNLLVKVEDAAARLGMKFKGFHKSSKANETSPYFSTHGYIESNDDNDAAQEGDYNLISGNAWLFARPQMENRVDYLFIDEAGQVSLADALAVSLSAKNVVLLGDPMQLAHVSQGSHPFGCGRSILQHLLGSAGTVREDCGVFLDVTHRLSPALCEFVSEAFYDSRLRPGNTQSQVTGHAPGFGSGIRYIPVQHSGNGRQSPEEAAAIVETVKALFGATVTESNGTVREAHRDDIIIVAPYNAQRRLIRRALEREGFDVRVGTVDKFQGQEAAAVIYSMTSSSRETMPGGLDFVLNRNRVNVAISRARSLALVIGAPSILESRPRSVGEIALLSVYAGVANVSAPLRLTNS